MKFRVLKGVKDVYTRADGNRVFVLHPTPNRPSRAFTKAKGKATAVKLHYTHVIYPVNKASAPDNRRYS